MAKIIEDFEKLRSVDNVLVFYDRRSDQLVVRLRTGSERWVADAVDEEWSLLVDAVSGELVGYMVEEFERVYLKNHPEVAAAWHEARRPWLRWSTSVQDRLNQFMTGFFKRRAELAFHL